MFEDFEILRLIDSVPRTLTPHRNLFFSFKNFKDWNDNGINTTALIFQRTAYNIYPDLLYGNAGNFTPFDTKSKKKQINIPINKWIQEKNISHTVQYRKTPDKSVTMNVIQHFTVPPPQYLKSKIGIIKICFTIIISLICTGTFGFALSSLFFKRVAIIEFISVSILIGIGSSAIIIQSLSMVGILPSSTIIGTIGVTGVLGLYFRKEKLSKILSKPIKIDINIEEETKTIKSIKICAWIILLTVLIIIFFNACILPLYAWDGFMIWLLKTKVLIHEPLNTTSFFTNRSYGFAHLKYPLLIPFMYSSFSLFTGGFNLYCARSPELFIFISGVLLFYYIFKKESQSSIFSLLLISSLFLSPVFLVNCGVGVADTVLSIFYGASIYYQFRYFNKQTRQNMIIAMLFTSLCGLTKNEGIALCIISMILFSFFTLLLNLNKKNIINSLIFTFGIVTLLLPHIIWSHSIPDTDENYPQHLSTLFTMAKISLIPSILYKFASTMLSLKFLSTIIVTLFALLIADRTFLKSQLFWTRFTYFASHFCLYILVFAITPWNLLFLYNTALDRVILHLLPALLLLAATAYGYSHSRTKTRVGSIKTK